VVDFWQYPWVFYGVDVDEFCVHDEKFLFKFEDFFYQFLFNLSVILYLLFIFFYITLDSSIKSNFDWLTFQGWDQAAIVCVSNEITDCKILLMFWA
jgi:hypothetical protein